ncbi:MAG: CotH kinase family protein [SAR324 cluster bacterium]|nr:CotH kinase family protein [SAR324 cluster bacterium]MBF0349783.1 CotH kinase family protein [SAR324 cluster bacterium]
MKSISGKILKLLRSVIGMTLLIAGCGDVRQSPFEEKSYAPELVENRSIYQNEPQSVLAVHITTLPEPGGFTLDDVNNDNDPFDTFEPEVKVLFKEGKFGQNLTVANAALRQRGHSTREALQKSYRVKLFSSTELWRNNRSIHLMKHPYDLTRVRNKLSYDLFKTIPDFVGAQVLFVHLYIDETDYGLYTTIDNFDKYYLQQRGFTKGQLYKAENFTFNLSKFLKLKEDPAYNIEDFETVLGIDGNDDHSKLIHMLKDINNYSIPINTVIDRYFNKSNYLTWLAINILTGNFDTFAQNFYLYSPKNSQYWYFFPWDYDGAWGFNFQPNENGKNVKRWNLGISNWWNSILHQRFLMVPENMGLLNKKIDEIKTKYLNPSKIQNLLEQYKIMVRPVVTVKPDLFLLPTKNDNDQIGEYDQEFSKLAEQIEIHYQLYKNAEERPMPIFLGKPELLNGEWFFQWEASYDLQGDAITYDFQISTNPLFSAPDIVFAALSLPENVLSYSVALNPGTYYWRIIIRDTKNPQENWQIPYDSYVVNRVRYDGILKLVVPSVP